MPIENGELTAGTRLVARYKGRDYSAEVVETEEGLRYRLEDGREFKSPSSAGSAIMGGKACNGWRLWSLTGDEQVKTKISKPAKTGKRQKATQFERLEDGRRFCNGCMTAFEVADEQEPTECPQGHRPDGREPGTAI